MQNRMWKLYPSFPLSPSISLLRPSSCHSFKRFQEHSLAYPYHVISPQSSRPVEDEDEEMQDAELIREKSMEQLSRTSVRTSAGVKDYFRISKSASPGHRAPPPKITELAIPIQPRKGHAVRKLS